MALTQVDQGLLGPQAQYTGFKNRLINGAMMIDQRNAGASVTPTTDGQYTVDRWGASISQASKFSVQQNAGSVTPPTGFANYLGATSLSAYSVLTNDYFLFQQKIEGLNVSDLGWGTASASAVTLSFWVRSSLTGTFGGSLNNSAINRSYPFTYTISAANTWEQKSIIVAGDTSGTWLTTSGIGLRVILSLGAGSGQSGSAGAWAGAQYLSATGATSVVGTNGATFYITGVQLEKGSTATSFDYRPYGTELALCQRYYYRYILGSGYAMGIGTFYGANDFRLDVQLKQTMRSDPTLIQTTGSGYYNIYYNNTSTGFTTWAIDGSSNSNNIQLQATTSAGTAGYSGLVRTGNALASVAFNAEL